MGAILIDAGEDRVLYPIAAIGLFLIWYVWFRVVRVRHLVVDYHKYAYRYFSKYGKSPEGICSEEQYIKRPVLRQETNDILDLQSNWRLTRVKVDLILPIAYSLIWLLLVFL